MTRILLFLGALTLATACAPSQVRDTATASNPPVSADNEAMRIHFVDVGQGLGVLLEFPCAAMLIDTGGEQDGEFDSEALDGCAGGDSVIDGVGSDVPWCSAHTGRAPPWWGGFRLPWTWLWCCGILLRFWRRSLRFQVGSHGASGPRWVVNPASHL